MLENSMAKFKRQFFHRVGTETRVDLGLERSKFIIGEVIHQFIEPVDSQ